MAGKHIPLLLAATLAVASTSASHAFLSDRDESPADSLPPKSGVIQVGALESEAEARERLQTARQYAQPLLDNAREYIEAVDKGSKRLYRARFAVDADMVKPVCATLKKANLSCIAIAPTQPASATPVVASPARAAPGQPAESPKGRTTSPPPHRAEPAQPKSLWQAIKDSVK